MAESPSHRFGQIIGNLLEEILLPVLLEFCKERNLYLDRHGARIGVRPGRKVSWEDKYGNTHDLDFVIEKNGSAEKRGRPVAFIEAAWRRYTKHSRNKVQEIQGAILPIAEKYSDDSPFLGAVLAGVFTKGSLDQLESVGFKILFLPYETIIEAFESVGINARFDELTADKDFLKCVKEIEELSKEKYSSLKKALLDSNKEMFDKFFTLLRSKLDKIVEKIVLLPLFGNNNAFSTIEEAQEFLDNFDVTKVSGDFQRYELIIIYSNKDEIRGSFTSKKRAKDFLRYVSETV